MRCERLGPPSRRHCAGHKGVRALTHRCAVAARADAQPAPRPQVEIKNMNSFAAMARAIDFEVQRQVGVLTGGGGERVVQETRLWEEGPQRTVTMRKKEGLADYRYYPEPDLPPVTVTPALLSSVVADMPELPAQARLRAR